MKSLLHDIVPIQVRRSPESQARVEACRDDEFKFFETYLLHYFSLPSAALHREIVRLMKEPPKAEEDYEIIHGELIKIEPDAHIIVVAAPREFAKSTLVSFGIVLHRICYGLSSFIVPVSDTEGQAKERLEDVKLELETNELIREDFGDLMGRKWTEAEIITANNIKVVAKGTGSAMRGMRFGPHRPDFIICDDLENDNHVESPAQRDKNERWFNKALLNCAGPGALVFVVGTILHYDSLLSRLLQRKEAFATRVWRAITDGESIWPERWSLGRLAARKRQIGSAAFEQEFQNNPLDKESRIFKPETFAFYRTEELPARLAVYGGMDLAISKKETADRTALVTIGLSDDAVIYVLECVAQRIGVTEQIALAQNAYSRWEHLGLGIEVVGYQKAFKEMLDDAAMFLPTVEIKQDVDKIRRLSSLATLIEKGAIRFREDQKELLEELEQFPKGAHDDMGDALEMAVRVARMHSGIIEFKSSGRKRVGLSTTMSRF